ncbi:unnamed protein product [Caenorhabditis angaria]|uniref:EGF-like domain-containing protein n=1 Tax=Caenorhabditis angaria TaxID=860376 RepID=A0A9P1IS72_9PELO|nr:unnamed protein product [Caenorhabditis angaria]
MWFSRLVFSAILIISIAAVLRKKKPCINGSPEGDKCYCIDGWTGDFCHRPMHCGGYERQQNGSCTECEKGWVGPDCDIINCNGVGTPNGDLTKCNCNEPYTGDYCEFAETKDIYRWYNNFTSSIGPIGIITIIPLALIYMCCEHFAKKRQLRRVEQHLNGVLVGGKGVDKELVKGLLEASDDEKSVKSAKLTNGHETNGNGANTSEGASSNEKKALLADPSNL